MKTLRHNTLNKNNRARHIIALTLLFIFMAVFAVILSIYNIDDLKVNALTIPEDYATGYGIENISNLENNNSFEGIICSDKSKKEYILQFSGDVNGLVTLARISHNDSLQDYTFAINYGGLITLQVNYDAEDSSTPISAGSFFGLGNDTYPFKGTIKVGGSQDTSIAIAEGGWKYLFNNLSNQGSIVSNGQILYSSNTSVGEDEDDNSFVFCKKLTVTANDQALDVSGFRFGSSVSGTRVHTDGLTALFANVIVTGAGNTFSVDLSSCFPADKYTVKSDSGDAAGLIASIGEGVDVTVKLPSSLNCSVTSSGTAKNAGLLVGTNHGTVTFTGDGASYLSGSLQTNGSAGLIGSNASATATVELSTDITINGLTVTAVNVGGVVGYNNGTLQILGGATVSISGNFTLTNSATCHLGGVAGYVDTDGTIDVEEGSSVTVASTTFNITDTSIAGGAVGYWKGNSTGVTLRGVTVASAAISFNQTDSTFGGFIGRLEAGGDFTLSLSSTSAITPTGLTAGVCGGVIGHVTSSALANTVLIEGDGVETCFVNTNSTANTANAVVGGVVGRIGESTYVKVNNLTLNNAIVKSQGNDVRYVNTADVAGNIEANGILDIGDLTLNDTQGSVLVGTTGVGSVVRLGGVITDSSTTVNNIVFQQDSSLIYKDSGCVYSGAASSYNDIASYGQVIRNDTLGIISMGADHKVSLNSPLSATDVITLSSEADFAKLAITFYTDGNISGVGGYDSANFTALLSKTINLTGNIDLTNTGIEQLTRPDSNANPFTGTFNGGGHTITLAIGQSLLDDTNNGDTDVYYGYNKRAYQGLFATLNGATVNDLTIDGLIRIGIYYKAYRVGSLAGYATGGLTVDGCTISTKIELVKGNTTYTNVYPFTDIGGLIGVIENATSLTVKNSELGAEISDSVPYTTGYLVRYFWGGLSGQVTYKGSSKIDLTNNNITTKLTKTGTYSYLQTGGLIGVLSCANYTEVDLDGTTADVSLTTPNATNSVGGIIGYKFTNCHLNNLNATYSGTIVAGSAALGGLVHTLTGRLTIESGFSLGESTFTTTKTNSEDCGLLLSDGRQAFVSAACPAGAFASVSADGFDLLVGQNISSYSSVGVAKSGGIVTIETGNDRGKIPTSSDWFTAINARQNSKTRYYFNILDVKNASTVAEKLLFWHVNNYSDGNLLAKVRQEYLNTTTVSDSFPATADADMTDYCFYPTCKESVLINFNNYSLTFATPTNATAKQFYGMQAGLLSDVSATSGDATVTLQNITLCGTVANLGGNVGSGAFICGRVNGNLSSSDSTIFTCYMTVNNVILDGLKVEGDSGYRPLLINTMASYVNATITNISQSGYVEGDNAACSLIGCGGVEESGGSNSTYLYVTLQGIALGQSLGEDGSVSSIFTHSMLFYDVKYVSATGSVIYNFTFAEDWGEGTPHKVTYGAELYFDKEQQQYFDNEIFVNPVTLPDESSVLYDFSLYLPYVFVGYNADGSSTNRLLSVNRKVTDFIEGWGTYENPYIINSPKQLIDLSIWLSGTASFNEGWQINFPRGDWSAVSKLNLTDYYLIKVTGGKLIYTDADSNTTELSTAVLLQYLAGAYYKIGENNLTLTADFKGLGSTSYPFHGVVHGNNKTLTLASPAEAITEAGYGFVNVANGCAIYGLTLSYGDIALSTGTLTNSMTATSAPNATTLTTSMPHFGGAIAWVVGGDNQIDNVTVTVDSVTGSCNTAFGSYVGLISGGGVLVSDLGEVGVYNSNTNLYHNNYIGRVLNGYAIAIDGVTYNNGKNADIVANLVMDYEGDFKIPVISLNNITAHSAGFNGTNTFTIGNAEELLMLSYALNSGALHSTTGYAYGNKALSRYGDYSKVGGTTTGISGGKYVDDTFKVALPAAYFGLEAQKALSSTAIDIKLTSTAYDMSSYGNGFRGMSGIYSDNYVYNIQSFGNDSQKATITVNMNMPQYGYNTTSDKSSGDIYDPDSITSYGLFGRSKCVLTFKNLVLTGNICVTTINYSNEAMYYTKSPANHVGGLLGQNSSSKSVTVNNVSMNGFTVVSPNCAGGFVGYYSGGTLTVNNTAGSNLSQNVLIKGQKQVGGCLGYLNKESTANITGFEIADSTIEAVQRNPKNNDDRKTGIGGVIGGAGAYKAISTFTNCAVTKTAVVLYASYSATDSSIASGGLLGWTGDNGSITATGCTVDGCVIFSLGNFSGSDFPYDAFIGSDSTVAMLSDDIKNNLIYNGVNQSSVKVLAYFLKENSNKSNFSIGSAGGLLGTVSKKVTLENCTVTAKSAPVVIASLHDSAGLVGEQRSNADFTIKNCTVSTQGHDMYIMGLSCSAGIMAYRNSATNAMNVTNCNVVGTQANPVRIVQYIFNYADAGGLFGDLGATKNLTATNCRVSYCIIAGRKASAILSTTQSISGTLKNIHVDNNVIYGRNSYVGGLFNEYTATMNVEGVYLANNHIIGYTGAGGLVGTATSGTLSGKFVIMDNNTVCKGNQASNYTFATSDLVDGAAASTLYNKANPDFTNTGIIAGNNAATVQLTAVSCSLPDSVTTQQKNFGAGSSSTSYVVYNAYGAGAEYAGYTTEYDTKTPQQLAIEARNYSAATGDGSALFYGDSVTAGTPLKIKELGWWPNTNTDVTMDIKELGVIVEKLTYNTTLPLYCMSGVDDANIKGYINMLTGGGFGSVTALDSNLVSIVSHRYTVNAYGSLTKGAEGSGSVIYSGGTFKKGVYDNLEGDSKSFTILSIIFKDSSSNVYTLDIPIYCTRSVNLKTFVMPVEGEQYNLNLFTSPSEPSGSLPINLSFGSSFTLYVEFNYNDVAMTSEGLEYFKKQIELTGSNGQSNVNAKIESGTAFVLIDLNSSSPSGYSFYTLTLTADTRFINFADFKNGETGFTHVNFSIINEIGKLIENRLCKDMGSGCIYTEKYLLVVVPVHNADITTYNMKAIIDEEHRAETNVIVRKQKEVYGQVTVWPEPAIDISAEYVDGSAEGISFSYQEGETIKMQVTNTITYPDGYVDTLQGQGGKVYETHILYVLDSNSNTVELPQRTVIKVVDSDSNVIFNDELSSVTSQLTFSFGNVLLKPSKSYTIEISFAKVSYNEFYLAFPSSDSTAYTLVDTMYLSVVEGVLGVGAKSAGKTYYAKSDAKIKLAVVPDEESLQNLAINLAPSNLDDATNNGQIGFSINALFSDANLTQANISFSVTKKVFNAETGRYEYVDLSANEAAIWQVLKGDTPVTGDTLTVADRQVRGNYKLIVDRLNKNLAVTNYRLNVTLTVGGSQVSEYFVFLVCNINTDLP